jgi:PST family polysaccharide transporter
MGQLLVGIVAARVLAPADFGVFAVTLVVYSIVVNVSELGVGSALIRSPADMDALAPTAVTVSLVTSGLLAGTMAALAPVAASGFGIDAAAGPIRVMSLVVLLAGPGAVPTALLTKRFRQDKRLLADAMNFLAANGLLVALALMGGGAYALAWSRVAGQLVSVVVLLWVAEKRYRPGYEASALRYLLRLGLPLVGANLIGFAISAVDVVVVGNVLGAHLVGLYNLALNVATWPLQLVLPVLINVGLPLVALFQSDRRELGKVVGSLTAATVLIVAPAAGLLAVTSHVVVRTLYGDAWVAAGPVLAVLAIAGGMRVLLALYFDVLVACNAARSLFWIQLAWLVALIPAVVVGVRGWGPIGAAWAWVAVVGVVVLPLTLAVCGRRVGVSLRHAGGDAVWLLGAACIAVLAAAAVLAGMRGHAPVVCLLAAGATGTCVYALLGWRSARTVVGRLRRLIDSRHTSEHVVDEPVMVAS